jgi:hypothetical protein
MLRYEGYNAYFDCDNLSTISKEKLAEGIAKSCCVVCILPVSCHDLHSFFDSYSSSMMKLYLQSGAGSR